MPAHVIDMKGKRYGKLLVVKRGPIGGRTLWVCRCDCGRERLYVGHDLRRGLRITCGGPTCKVTARPNPLDPARVLADYMRGLPIYRIAAKYRTDKLRVLAELKRAGAPKRLDIRREDLRGQRFGLVTVIASAGSKPTNGNSRHTLWKCRCDCGGVKIFSAHYLKGRKANKAYGYQPMTSCGCRAAHFTHGQSESPIYHLYAAAKLRARRKGLDFTLNLEDLVVADRCLAFGKPMQHAEGGPKDDSPSIDRLDPRKGYTKENVRVISYRANRIKNDATLEELKLLVAYLEREMGRVA